MPQYPLQTLLASIANSKGSKRILFNMGPIGGLSSSLIILFFVLLPILEYTLFFNPYMFKMLGIATAIIAYIVSLSLVMIVVFLVTWKVNHHVIQKITPSWGYYFGDRELGLVLSSGASPYSEFFDHYAQGIQDKMSSEELHRFLMNAFLEMEKKNKELLDAMNRNKNLSH